MFRNLEQLSRENLQKRHRRLGQCDSTQPANRGDASFFRRRFQSLNQCGHGFRGAGAAQFQQGRSPLPTLRSASLADAQIEQSAVAKACQQFRQLVFFRNLDIVQQYVFDNLAVQAVQSPG